MQKIRKVKKIKWYHEFISNFSSVYTFLEEEDFKKEFNRRKRMIKNIKRLLKDPDATVTKKSFKKAFDEIERMQKEVDYMEKQFKK